MAHRLSALKGGEGVIAPHLCDKLWAADSGGWSSAIAPSCPYLAVRSSGIGASCDSYFHKPLIPLRSSQTERRLVAFVLVVFAPLPRAHLKEPTRVVLGHCCRVHEGR